MNTIWQFNQAHGPEIGKEYPQVQKTVGGYWDISAPIGVQNQLKDDFFPNGIPPFGQFKLHANANLTDVLSTAMLPIRSTLISPWCKSVLETFKLGQHWFFPVELLTPSGKTLPYYVFHFNNDCSGSIDFSKSTFAISEYCWENFEMKEMGELTFHNKLEYYAFMDDRKGRKGKTISPKKITLDTSSIPQVDIFYLYRIGAVVHIKDSLRQALQEARISGWECEPSWVVS